MLTKFLSAKTRQKRCEVIHFSCPKAEDVLQMDSNFAKREHLQLLNGLSELACVYFIAPENLYPFHKVRQEAVDPLVDSLKSDNMWRKPLLVERNTLVILDGHRQHQAALKLGLAAVPCLRISHDNPYLETVFNVADVISTKEILINAALTHRLLEDKLLSHRLTKQFVNLEIPLEILQKEFYSV